MITTLPSLLQVLYSLSALRLHRMRRMCRMRRVRLGTQCHCAHATRTIAVVTRCCCARLCTTRSWSCAAAQSTLLRAQWRVHKSSMVRRPSALASRSQVNKCFREPRALIARARRPLRNPTRWLARRCCALNCRVQVPRIIARLQCCRSGNTCIGDPLRNVATRPRTRRVMCKAAHHTICVRARWSFRSLSELRVAVAEPLSSSLCRRVAVADALSSI